MNPKTVFTDTVRLEWLVKNSAICEGDERRGFNLSNRYLMAFYEGQPDEGFATAREAIDDVMRREDK